MEIKAKAKFIRTAPRKVRLVCDLIRGNKLLNAESQLMFLKKQAASDLLSLLKSAKANAKQKDLKPENLYIKEIKCDQGPSLKRSIYKSRGSMTPIKKRMSHVCIVLSDEHKSKVTKEKIKNIKDTNNIKNKSKKIKGQK
ncbi:MAG: 50S ribosomal protein L22 [Candidatus Berkelbacteria bacterium]|nr:50S ribosomal protein L22 [Candidatus Berkelbacteria bacterium]